MKKKLLLLFLTMALFVCSLCGVMVSASADNVTYKEVTASNIHTPSGVNVVKKEDGVLHATNIAHAEIISFSVDGTLDGTAHKYLNVKGNIGDGKLYRIKVFEYIDGSSDGEQLISRLFDTSSSSSSETTVDSDGYFEWHYEVPATWTAATTLKIGFQCYVQNSGTDGELQILGFAFDTDGTYSDWAALNVVDGENGGEEGGDGGDGGESGGDTPTEVETTFPANAANSVHQSTLTSHGAAGVFVLSNIKHNEGTYSLRYTDLSFSLDTTNHTYLHIKFAVKNVDRIRLTYKSASDGGANTPTLLADIIAASKQNADGSYELHYKLPSDDFVYSGAITQFRIKGQFDSAVNDNDNYIEFVGLAFTNEATYTNWAEFQTTLIPPAPEKTEQTAPTAEVFTIDYINERMSFPSTVEVFATKSGESYADELVSGGKITPAATYYFRYKETDTHKASDTVEYTLSARETLADITPTTVTADTIVFALTGYTFLLGDGQWTESGTFLDLDPQTQYAFLVKRNATETAFASEVLTVTVTTAEKTEEIPDEGTQTPDEGENEGDGGESGSDGTAVTPTDDGGCGSFLPAGMGGLLGLGVAAFLMKKRKND